MNDRFRSRRPEARRRSTSLRRDEQPVVHPPSLRFGLHYVSTRRDDKPDPGPGAGSYKSCDSFRSSLNLHFECAGGERNQSAFFDIFREKSGLRREGNSSQDLQCDFFRGPGHLDDSDRYSTGFDGFRGFEYVNLWVQSTKFTKITIITIIPIVLTKKSASTIAGRRAGPYSQALITSVVFACRVSARHGCIAGQDEREVLESVVARTRALAERHRAGCGRG